MKAIVQDRYGPTDDVLELRELPVPRVRDREVLARVRDASVHPDVWHVVAGRPYVMRLMGAVCAFRFGMGRSTSRSIPRPDR